MNDPYHRAGKRHLGAMGRQEMWVGMGLTLLFHGTLVALAVLGLWLADGVEEEDDDALELVFDDVELLALGEEREPDQMPRFTGDEGQPLESDDVAEVDPEAPPEPPEPDAEVDPEPTEEEEEVDEEAEQRERDRRAEEEERQRQQEQEERRRERQRRMDEALGQFDADGRGDQAPEGSPEGVEGGTVTDADMANMEQTYHARLLQMIERHWRIPTVISDEELQELSGRVSVRVELSEEGHIEDFEFRQRADHDEFDASIERVLREFMADHGGHTLPMPEQDDIREQLVQRGLILSTWEHLQR